jgi:hypothetical protein
MIKPTIIALSALALVVLGTGVQRVLFSDLDQVANNKKLSPTAVPRPGPLAAGLPADKNVLPGRKASTEATTPRNDPSQEAAQASPVDDNVSEPDAVIGRPFALSASVRDQCKKSSPGVCSFGYNAIAQMEQEPRDPAWAPMMEAKIAASIAADSSQPSIRTIECRQTICAFETATLNGSYTGPSYEFEAANHVLTSSFERRIGTWMYGLETDASGATIVVRVGFLVRR